MKIKNIFLLLTMGAMNLTNSSFQCMKKKPTTTKKAASIKSLKKVTLPKEKTRQTKPYSLRPKLLNSLIEGDGVAFAQIIRRYITNVSETDAFDSVIKILDNLHNSYTIKSDKNAGDIKTIILIPKSKDHQTIVIGLKKAKEDEELKKLATYTLHKTHTYALKLGNNYKALTIFGIAFTDKDLALKQFV